MTTAFAADVTRFGLECARRLDDGRGNLLLSPASLVGALAMVAPGARGATAAEIVGLLGADRTPAQLAAEAGGMQRRLTEPADLEPWRFQAGDDPAASFTLRIANDVWAQQGLRIRDEYLALLGAAFGPGLHQVDFLAAAEQARQAINEAVAERTGGEIPELLQPGDVGTLTRLVLTNAVYLNASWLQPFEPGETAPAPFHLLDGSVRSVAMLRQQAQLPYARDHGWHALQLDYVGDRLTMLLLLPEEPAGPHPERTLTADLVGDLRRALRREDVRLWLPKLRLESALNLGAPLADLGMRLAFTDQADFGAMVDDAAEPILIDRIIQRAIAGIDEKGTVAAAATAVVMRTVAFFEPADPVELRFDRPFLLLIQETGTGYPLFLARVTEPPAA